MEHRRERGMKWVPASTCLYIILWHSTSTLHLPIPWFVHESKGKRREICPLALPPFLSLSFSLSLPPSVSFSLISLFSLISSLIDSRAESPRTKERQKFSVSRYYWAVPRTWPFGPRPLNAPPAYTHFSTYPPTLYSSPFSPLPHPFRPWSRRLETQSWETQGSGRTREASEKC